MKASKAIIVAVDQEWGIGKDGVLPWHLPEDLKRFKDLTQNSICIMGYNTYKEIADRFKYEETGKFLPNRRSWVITSRDIPTQSEVGKPEVLSFKSIKDALGMYDVLQLNRPIFFIGGARIFEEALPLVDTIYFTQVNADFDCDVRFPCRLYRKLAFEETVEKEAGAFVFIKAVNRSMMEPEQLEFDFK